MHGSLFGYLLSSRLLGRRREREEGGIQRRPEELVLLFPVLAGTRWDTSMPTQKLSFQTPKGPRPPGVSKGNEEGCILQPPPLLPFPTFWWWSHEEVSSTDAGSSSGRQKFFVEAVHVLFSCTHTFTSSSQISWPWLCKGSHVGFHTLTLRGGWASLQLSVVLS